MIVQLIAILASVVLLMILVHLHRRVTRRKWEPVFEEELEESPDGDDPEEPDEAYDRWEDIS